MSGEKVNVLSKSSFRLMMLIVVLAYFAVGCYWLAITYKWSLSMGVELETYQRIIKEFWWVVLFYSSELGGSIGIVFRWIAALFALYSAILFFKDGEAAIPRIKGKAALAILFEALYFLTYIPSVILGFAYPIAAAQKLWYFEPSPPWIITFMIAGVSCLAMVVVIMPSLFKLRSKIIHGSTVDIARWASITGLSYLFVMFWLNYSIAWACTLVYWPERAQPGIEILYRPHNMISFPLTIVGLLLISLACLKTLMPAIKGHPSEVNLKRLGAVLLALGAYFLVSLVLFYAAGGYHAEPTTWMELISPFHNPDFWCFSLIFPGAYLAAERLQK
ncbi:hypothetical protein H5T51_08290 [Candidatus Bathyarchaeota archaeon]|nr:hypothetical protein [Candidatus Bathyarchaeota archaeon]